MNGRWIVFGAALGFVLALTLGFAHARGPSTPGPGSGSMDMGEMWAVMDEMHGSPAMQDMHERMPAELRAQCDAMHEQMRDMMPGGAGGMGGMGAGMGSMSGGMGNHAAHHPDTSGS